MSDATGDGGSGDGPATTRRRFLAAAVASGVVGVAGCSGDTGGDRAGTAGTRTTGTATSSRSTTRMPGTTGDPTDTTGGAATGTGTENGRPGEVGPVPDEGHPLFQFDAANTGHAPDGSGPDGPLAERWSVGGGGERAGEPAVVGDTVYHGPAGVTASSTADGATRWSYDFDGYDHTFAALAVVGSTVVAGTSGGRLVSIDADSGRRRWSFDTDEDRLFAPPTAAVTSAGPTVFASTFAVYEEGSSTLYAMDAATGDLRWSEVQGGGFVGLAVAGGTVYAANDSELEALAPSDGTRRWNTFLDGDSRGVPTVVGGTVYLGDSTSLYALSAEDGSQRWSVERVPDPEASPAVTGDRVYVPASGSLYAVGADDGEPRWRTGLPGSVEWAPAVVDGTVYAAVQREGSSDLLVGLDPADGTERFRFDVGGRVSSAPVVAGGAVYLVTHSGLLALEAE